MTYQPEALVAIDCETHLIQPGLLAPPIVCGAISIQNDELLTATDYLDSLKTLARMKRFVLTGLNVAYDLACAAAALPDHERLQFLQDLVQKFSRSEVYDVAIGEMLNAIADGMLDIDPRTGTTIRKDDGRPGKYSLEFCAALRLGRAAKGNDFWRRRYAILESLPIEAWPADAQQYPCNDSRNTLDAAREQLRLAGEGKFRNLENMPEQVETAFWLHCGAVWGIRTDRARYEELCHVTALMMSKFQYRFMDKGFIRANGKQDSSAVKRAVALAYGADPHSQCPRCGGSQKVPSAITGKPVICKGGEGGCDGTGLDLESVPALPRADKGGIKTDRDTLTESGDQDLEEYGENECKKIAQTYLPFLARGLEVPITPYVNVLLESGRTSYDDVIQLTPRQVSIPRWMGIDLSCYSAKPDVRGCFKARPGFVFGSCDYAAIELCTLAQFCLVIFGHSRMAEIINATQDPGALHADFAAICLGLTIEEFMTRYNAKEPQVRYARQGTKILNYGLGGGMGAAKLVLTRRKRSEGKTIGPDGREYVGIRFCILLGGARECSTVKITEWKGRHWPPICKECVELVDGELRPKWFKRYPEVKELHGWVNDQVQITGELPCLGYHPSVGLRVERVRGGLGFTDGANNCFQALNSELSKAAFRAVARECYTDPSSALYGSRPIFLQHDDIFTEIVACKADAAARRQAEIEVAEGQKYCPDVCIKAEPALMHYWSKDAETKYNDRNELIPWDAA